MTTQETPRNIKAEKALLGALLVDHTALYRIKRHVGPDDFWLERHAMIYRAIRDLDRKRDSVDFVTICDELRRRGQLDEVGGKKYVTQLYTVVPSGLNAESYAMRVAEMATRRRMIEAAEKAAKLAWQEDRDLDDVRLEARDAFERALNTNATADALLAVDAVDVLYEQVGEYAENPLKPGEVRGLSTGLIDLDDMLGGLGSGLYLVGGVQHTGKTAFTQQLAANVARQGKPAIIFSMEHAAEDMFHRIASAEAKISLRDVRAGLGSKRLEKYYAALDRIADWPIEVIGKRLTISQIEAEIRERERDGLALAVVDNIELASSSIKARQDYVRFRDAAYWLLSMAQENTLPLLTTMQIGTKKVAQRNDNKPNIGDLYGADGPAQAASVVLLLHRDDRWTFNERDKTKTMEVTVWKDKVYYSGTGKGREFVFGDQGQVWDKARDEVAF